MKLKGTKEVSVIIDCDMTSGKEHVTIRLPKTVVKALLKEGMVDYECELEVQVTNHHRMKETKTYTIELKE